MHKEYCYSSVFAEYLTEYVSQKREAGFQFDLPAYWLFRFDRFCSDTGVTENTVSKELYDQWIKRSPSETKTTQNSRGTALRGFCIYLNAVGVSCYVPNRLPKPEKKVPYLMDDASVREFFAEVDRYKCQAPVMAFRRLAEEYRVIFRLIYCCGLRNSEACTLKTQNIDTEEGILTVIHSKGDKDRLVYLANDLNALCCRYKIWLTDTLGFEPEWFFPGKYPEAPIPKTSVDRKFNEFWNRTLSSCSKGKKPTVHSLRHGYVIKRMDLWMEEGVDFQVMMPYLSSYLGHTSPDDTFYYYHQIEESFSTLRQRDTAPGLVIPEVGHE